MCVHLFKCLVRCILEYSYMNVITLNAILAELYNCCDKKSILINILLMLLSYLSVFKEGK